MDSQQFPIYAKYIGEPRVFNPGDILVFRSFRSMSEKTYNKTYYGVIYKPSNNGYIEEGYAEYSLVDGTKHGIVHISEIEEYYK